MSAYVEIAPPPALRPFVECLWVHRIDGPPPAGGRRLLPSGRVDVVWLGELGVRVSGPQTRYSRPLDLPPMLVFGARFHPGAAPYLLRTPAVELADRHVALDAIDPVLARRLGDRRGAIVEHAHGLAHGRRDGGADVRQRARAAAPSARSRRRGGSAAAARAR